MELKQFQRKVIQDIRDYLYEYKTTENASQTVKISGKGVNVGFGGIQRYVDEKHGKPKFVSKCQQEEKHLLLAQHKNNI